MTGAERQRRYRERHALPAPEWQRGLLVVEANLTLEQVLAAVPDPAMRSVAQAEAIMHEWRLEHGGGEDED